ncbi:MAG TPA: glycosyltransferase, partial [Terrimesophilobacter sp.]|uniref:glycosyltransferase n=1 Tax=Terrimesophilobacter sp. TaxID=2906435 RepID=UPI002F943094
FTSRSTVASRLAEFYAEDFGFETPAIVRNCPPFVDQNPSPVDPKNIKLVFHGMASWARGLRDICDALRMLDERFSVTFMLTPNRNVIAEVEEYARDLGDRVRFVPPVPMRDVSSTLNEYDLEIMFYQPESRNLEFSLPNKFFEAIQGRLGLVIGKSPMMSEIVSEFENGVIVDGWSTKDLADTLSSLTSERITALKSASHRAAVAINAETERSAFLESIGASA